MKAAEIMTQNYPTVWFDLPIVAAAQIMLGCHVTALVVVDPAGKMVGMITADDLIGRDGTPAHDGSEIRTRPARAAAPDDRRVGDLMTRDFATVREDADEEEVSCLMRDRQVEGVAVFDKERLVGIANRTDLLLRQLTSRIKERAEKRHDDEAIRERIFAELPCHLWARIEGVHIDVENGIARISGIITDEAVRDELSIVGSVPGVTGFADSLLVSDSAIGDVLP
ncbi:MAG: CBS domain-containing protein [Bifidobacterium asteroides]